MLDDLQIIDYKIKLNKAGNVKLYAVGDVHLGSPQCDIEGFKAFINRVKSEPRSYVVLVGDILDNATVGSVSNCYEATLTPSQQVDLATELLEPIADRIIAGVRGNHEARTSKQCDLDPLYVVFCRLHIEQLYRVNAAFVKLSIGDKIKTVYTLCVTHGKSDAKRKKFQLHLSGIDVLITGHTHNPLIEQPCHIQFNRHKGTVNVHKTVSIVGASWMNYGGYGLGGLYLANEPASNAPQAVILNHSNSRTNSGDDCRKITAIWG